MALDQAKLQIHSGSPAWSFLPNDNTYTNTDGYTLRQTHRYTHTHKDTDIGTDTGTNTHIYTDTQRHRHRNRYRYEHS